MNVGRFLLFSIVAFLVIPIVFSAENSLTLLSPNYFEEQDNTINDISYLENEHLSFETCFSEIAENISAVVICGVSEEELELVSFGTTKDSCYFSNKNIKDISCSDFSLEVRFTEESTQKKFRRNFVEEEQSKLLNYVLGANYRVLDPKDLSHYLAVLNNIESKESAESIDAYERLRDLRNNDNKCWPSSSCSIGTTADVLANLHFAGYTEENRLLEDGKIYLERNLISNENDPLKFTITIDYDFTDSDDILSCDLTIDNDDPDTYEFEEDDSSFTIEEKASDSLIFSCNDTVDDLEFNLYNLEDKIKESEDYEDISSFSYSLEDFGCVGSNSCEYEDTINTLIAFKGGLADGALLDSYLNTLIIEDDDEVYLDVSNRNEGTGKYLYYKSESSLIDDLKFSQNNDGSWGSGTSSNRILETSWAVLGLQKVSSANSENVQDAKEWIYQNEPSNGWGSLERNSLAFLAIKERVKPYLKLTVENYIQNNQTFTIENPTIYNLRNVEVTLSEEIDKVTSYVQNLGNIEGEETKTFQISVQENFLGQLSGIMTVTGFDGRGTKIELISIPIALKGPTPFTLENNVKVTSSQNNKEVKIPIIHSLVDSYITNCTYTNPFTQEESISTVTESLEFFTLTNNELKEGMYTLELSCVEKNSPFTTSTNFNITVIEPTFTVNNITEVKINSGNDFSVSVTNTFGERQILSIGVTGGFVGFIQPTETEKILGPDDTRDIFFSVNDIDLLFEFGNITTGEITLTSETGFSKSIPIVIGEIEESNSKEISLWIWIIIIFVLLLILLVIVRYIQLKNLEKNQAENGGNMEDEEFILDEEINFNK